MENNLIKYIVYCTTCTVNNKIYVGVHKTNPEIFDGYIGNNVYVNRPSTYEHPKERFQYAVKKYGVKNFKRAIIAIFDEEIDAYNLEEIIVNKEFLSRPDVYNVALGGKSGNYNITGKTIYQYSEDGKFIAEYRSIKEASIQIQRNMSTLQVALKNKHKCAGYFWTEIKFKSLDLSKMHSYEDTRKIPVFQYSDTGEYDCCYESISDASRVLNIHSASISNALKLGCICNGKYFTNTFAPNFSISKSKQINSTEVHQYDLNGNYIASFKNMSQAQKSLNIKSNIYQAIKLGRTAGNYQWSFEKLERMSKVQPKAGKARKVGKFDKDWNLICEYKSLAECKKENGGGMEHVLRGRDEFAKGFRYKYMDI